MSKPNNAGMTHELPPEAKLLQLVSGCFVSSALHVAAKLGIAEIIFDGPKSAAELAAITGMHEHSLYRVMRALSSIGVFTESDGRTFANTPMSDTLRRDAPNSTLYMTLWMLTEPHWRVYGDLFYSVQTGRTNWDKVHGEPVFNTLFETDRELGDIFNKAMTSYSHQTIPAILDAYEDFSKMGKVVDVAGGHGHLLSAILRKYPSMQGVLFEFPPVLDGAPEMLASYGVTDRAELVGGDFCTDVPVVADVYMLKHIVHDWYDDKCQIILGNIRRVMPDDARVLIIDAVIPGPNEPHFAKFLDLEMLMLPGGMERTAEEFESLLEKSGFRMTRIIPTHSPVSIVEAVKA
jgi:hypothetical protein